MSTSGGGGGAADTTSIDPNILEKLEVSLQPSTHSPHTLPPWCRRGRLEAPLSLLCHPALRALPCTSVHESGRYRALLVENDSCAPGGVARRARVRERSPAARCSCLCVRCAFVPESRGSIGALCSRAVELSSKIKIDTPTIYIII